MALNSTYAAHAQQDRPQQIRQGLDLKGLDEDDVKSVVQQELEAALGQDGGQLSSDRLKAQAYYNGEPLGTEVEGRSQVVMLNVLEAVEWVLPALLRIFTSTEQICVIEPNLPGQEQQAKQATDYVNHIFHRDNPGFLLLHDFFKTALLEKTGWMRWRWDTQKTTETESYSGWTQEQYDAIVGGDDDVEVLKHETREQPADEFNLDRPFPQPTPVILHDCTLRVTRSNGRVKLECIPPEEILVSRRATRDSLPFLAHRRKWTYSDLVQQGYDPDTLDEVPLSDTQEWNSERVERHRLDEDWPPLDRRDAAKEIWVEESWVQLAKTDQDTTDLYKVVTAGNGLIILTKDGDPDIEPADEIPFTSICPIPQPHKLIGLSLADLVMDLQLIKSTLLRQMLDNAYLSNWPRTEIADDVANENTYDDLLTLRPGGIVRTKRVGGLVPLTIPYTADKSFPLIEYLDTTQEVRTGVARSNNMISPDVLSNTNTGTMAMAQQAAAQRVELFARLFAHGIENVCRGIMGLVRKHQQQERFIRVTGGWLQVDPKTLRDSMPVTVSVGLGTGNRDQLLAHLMTLLQVQQQVVMQQGGPKGPLVYPQHVYAAVNQLTEAAGFKTKFFADPSQPAPPQPPQPPPPPDPAVMKAQAAMQALQMKTQADAQAQATKAQVEIQQMQAKATLEAQLAQQRLQHEMEIAERKADHEMQLERERSANDIVIARSQVEAQAAAQLREIELKYAAGAYSPQPKANGAADAG